MKKVLVFWCGLVLCTAGFLSWLNSIQNNFHNIKLILCLLVVGCLLLSACFLSWIFQKVAANKKKKEQREIQAREKAFRDSYNAQHPHHHPASTYRYHVCSRSR